MHRTHEVCGEFALPADAFAPSAGRVPPASPELLVA